MAVTQRRRKLLGEVLVEAGLVASADLDRAVSIQRENGNGERLGQVLLGMGAVTEHQVGQAIAGQLGLEFVDLQVGLPEEQALLTLPEHLARRFRVIPLRVSPQRMTLGMVDPLDILAIDDVRRLTGREIEPAVITPNDFLRILNQYPALDHSVETMIQEIKTRGAEDDGLETLRSLVDDAPVVRLVNVIIVQAVRRRASDIHVEPQENRVRIRYRIDGTLYNVMTPPKHIQAGVVSRVKIMAQMDIAERRLPQDGRIQLAVDGREIDLRVSTIPTIFGEKVVMRILDRGAGLVGLEKIGLLGENRQRFESLITVPYGIILLTGPTGSGKTTTLYGMLNRLNTTESNIITVEDPVEYQLPGVNQVQVNPKAGLTFATGLRSFLRQDPDIVMVGEIRDEETARIAIHAALTGHLVLSTLHTNDAPGAVTRLVDMGIEPFLVASSLVGVIAQRLVRVLCERCKQPDTLLPEMRRRMGASNDQRGAHPEPFYRPVGCEACSRIGYRGRTGIFEIMLMDEALRAMVTARASANGLKDHAVRAGMATLAADGLTKARLGVTSPEEVLDVVSADE